MRKLNSSVPASILEMSSIDVYKRQYLNYRPIEIATLIGKGSRQLTMDLVSVDRCAEYAAEDADITLQLKQVLFPMVVEAGLQELYFSIEEPMIRVLADIEMAGVRIDCGALGEYAVELGARLAELEDEIRQIADEDVYKRQSSSPCLGSRTPSSPMR